MRYRLRTLLIALAVAPALLAATWLSLHIEWSEEVMLLVAVLCAIPYWVGVAVLLAMNPRLPTAWGVAAGLAILWPGLFLMSFLQLAAAIPLWSVLLTSGSNLGQPLSWKSISIALGLTLTFFVWVSCVALIHG